MILWEGENPDRLLLGSILRNQVDQVVTLILLQNRSASGQRGRCDMIGEPLALSG
jgi:hypothetical protein